jgi:lipopolysaccharide transport protein LptA
MRWQTHARAGLGVLLILLTGGVTWYVMRQGPRAESVAPSPRTDDEAETEIGPDEIIRTDNNVVVYRIKFERGFIYPAATNRMRLVGVSGTLPRGGQPMEFRADEADIRLKAGAMGDPSKFDEMRLRGNVVIQSGPGADPLYLETSDALYNDLTGIMTTETAATMKRGNMSGSGTGATFDRNRSVMWIMADAKVSIATEGQGALDVTSGRAEFAQADQYMRFEETVRMERAGRVIETDAAVANLTPDGNRITSLELRGNSRVTGGSGGDGGVPNMRADDITITYGAESGLLERSVLTGASRLELPEGGGRSLAADAIDMGFAADGSTLTALDATGGVELKIPAGGGEPAREVRAPRLEARGAAPKGLERAAFSGGVEFREQAPAAGRTDAVDRVGRSESLVLGLDGGFDKIRNADFAGRVRFRDRDVTGEAPEATYGVDTKRIVLRGGSGTARVIQDDGTVDAKDIDLTLDPRKMLANGNVRSTLEPGSRTDRTQARPSILEDDQPVNITSRTLDYDGAADRAVYTGDARLWQGDTNIQAETIVLDDKTGNLEAHKNVRARFLIREDPAPGQKPEPAKPTLATAEDLIYDESRRQATFRGNARMEGPDGNIRAERIEIFLKEDGNTLDRAEAYDKVTASLANNRVATGGRLTYNAATQTYEMTGKPLVVRQQIEDKAAAGKIRCEKTEGAKLTLNRLTDSIAVEGANGAPSRTVPEPCGAKLPVP